VQNCLMEKLFYIFIGGGIGSVLRYALATWSFRMYGPYFPIGTLSVNLLGSFIVGAAWAFFEESTSFTPAVRSFIFIGLLGGFTTFSTYTLETLNLLREGEYLKATGNVFLSNILGLMLVLAGFAFARFMVKL
jgi:fluoride exporter